MTDALDTDRQRLHNTGYDALEALALGPNPGDKALLELAEAENRVLITLDKDFSELIFLHRVPHTGLIRLPDVRMSQRIEMVAEIIEAYGPELEERAMITLQGRRIRISHPPATDLQTGVLILGTQPIKGPTHCQSGSTPISTCTFKRCPATIRRLGCLGMNRTDGCPWSTFTSVSAD
ncbi:MAG: hypothetical protein F4Z18_13470 [Caldilineaceae bacterium SB0666_bin_21]|nr:hypothetical protein [Caldilineaceae bacterium SB0666_bin_21]